MKNLVGSDVEKWRDALNDPLAKLHLYGKTEIQPGRKMGHVTRLHAPSLTRTGAAGGPGSAGARRPSSRRWRALPTTATSARRRSRKARVSAKSGERSSSQYSRRGGIDRGQGQALCIKAEIGRAIADPVPGGVDRLVQQAQPERRMLRQGQHRERAAHRLAPRCDDLEAGGDRERDALAGCAADRAARFRADRASGRSAHRLKHGDEVGRSAGKQRQRPRRPACRSAAPPRAMPGATSRRRPHRAASPRSARSRWLRRAGSSCGSSLAEKGRQIDRVPLQLLEEDEQPMIGHPLRVEDPVEMIALVLHDPGVKALDLAGDDVPRRGPSRDSGSADAAARRRAARGPRGSPPSRMPALCPSSSTTGLISTVRSCALSPGISVSRSLGNPEDDDPVRLVHLGCGDAGAAGILHRLDHVIDEPAHPGCRRVVDRSGRARSTGCPMRAIFNSAMAAICGAGRVG